MTAAKSNVSRIPANAPKPQDRKPRQTPAQKAAARARQAEAVDGPIAMDLCGITLQIPVGKKMPLDVVLLANGDEEAMKRLGVRKEDVEAASLRLLLGPEQWATFMAARPTLEDFERIGQLLEESTGN